MGFLAKKKYYIVHENVNYCTGCKSVCAFGGEEYVATHAGESLHGILCIWSRPLGNGGFGFMTKSVIRRRSGAKRRKLWNIAYYV